MNRLLKFADFISESAKLSNLNRVYAMTPEWWSAWKMENLEKYRFEQDAFSKTFNVYDKNNDELVFVFDYFRSKIFTNKKPSTFIIKNELSQKDMDKVKDKAEAIQNPEAAAAEAELKKKKKEGDADDAAAKDDEKENKDLLSDLGI